MRTIVLFTLMFFSFSLNKTYCSEPDTLRIIDVKSVSLGEPPKEWKHTLPPKDRLYTNYSVVRSIDGQYLRSVSNSTGSWLEYEIEDIDITKFNVMTWQWKVDKFPEVGWEQESSNDDFAIRIELVYDFKGSYKNPLNVIRKGLITSIFKSYPPELIISYVWAVNVPADVPFASPNSNNTVVIPIESSEYIIGRWMKEKRYIKEDLDSLYKEGELFLKKIRIRADTDDSSSIVESGLKYIYLINSDN